MNGEALALIPRGIVKLNGEIVHGWIEFETEANSFYEADTFSLSFAIDAPDGKPAAWFIDQAEILVELLVAVFDGAAANADILEPATSIFYGRVDDLDYDPAEGVVELSGRDLTGKLIDTKTTGKWQNLPASEIVRIIAGKNGLTPVVTATAGKAGAYYEIDHVTLTHARSEWDLLTYLAEKTGKVVSVQGKALHFEDKPEAGASNFLIEWVRPSDVRAYPVGNVERLSFSKSLTVARDVAVKVRSWNAKKKTAINVTAKATKTKTTALSDAAQPEGDAQVYSYSIPGLTQEQALQRAQELLRQISAHELKLAFSAPGTHALNIRTLIEVRGTGTRFDTLYYPDTITRRLAPDDGGYSMEVSAKNHDPNSEVLV